MPPRAPPNLISLHLSWSDVSIDISARSIISSHYHLCSLYGCFICSSLVGLGLQAVMAVALGYVSIDTSALSPVDGDNNLMSSSPMILAATLQVKGK